MQGVGASGGYGSGSSDSTSLTSSAGGTVTVHGSGFKPNSTVTVTLHSIPTILGTVTTDSNGNFVHTFTLPVTAATGSHQIIMSGVDPQGASVSTTLSLTISTLPLTGSNSTVPLTQYALIFFAIGLFGYITARKRRLREI